MSQSLEEIKQQLRDLGVPIDGWEEHEEKVVESPILKRQAQLLEKVQELLERQVQNDLETLGELHEKVARLKHGGGA